MLCLPVVFSILRPPLSFFLLNPAMHFLFIADPLESFKIYKDTTFVMMRELQKRGHLLSVCEPQDLSWQSSHRVMAHVRDVMLTGEQSGEGWFRTTQQQFNDRPRASDGTRAQSVCEFDAVLMRKDPPFDAQYIYATHLLEQAEREGARVYNNPAAVRNHPEKLSILEFPDLIGPTIVTRDASDARRFFVEHQDIILKPLDGMGGQGIFRVKSDGLNLGSIIETLNRGGAETIMVQKFLPEIAQGDKRILLIAGQPVPYCLARIPQHGEVRGNLAAGGKGVAQALSEQDKQIAERLGPTLYERGLLLVGLDVIGDCLTEINVTSPTCFQEIFDQTGCDVAALFIDALEADLARKTSSNAQR